MKSWQDDLTNRSDESNYVVIEQKGMEINNISQDDFKTIVYHMKCNDESKLPSCILYQQRRHKYNICARKYVVTFIPAKYLLTSCNEKYFIDYM